MLDVFMPLHDSLDGVPDGGEKDFAVEEGGHGDFVGCVENGGKRAASAFTLIETAKINGLNPEVYLRDIIGRVADHPINRIGELLPWNMKAVT